MSPANESGERAGVRRGPDVWFIIKLILQACFGIIGFCLVLMLVQINTGLDKHDAVLKDHDRQLITIQTEIQLKTKNRDEQIADLRSNQNNAVVRLEKSVDKLTDKVDRIAEKVGAK